MCTNSRWIYNPYAKRSVLVSCGKCPACQQAKANKRAERIRNEVSSSTICLFITLTYTNDYVPYVKRSDLHSSSIGELNVYRNCTGRFVFDRHTGKLRFSKSHEIDIVDTVNLSQASLSDSQVKLYPHLAGLSHDFIGVCYYPDLQRFWKRLRVILLRNYDYSKHFSYFCCSEFGSHSFRPHFHALLFVSANDEQIFRSAILAAWPFADFRRTEKYIEIAKDAASYVSSYVNSNSNLFPLMQEDVFKQKHSCSKHFGVVSDCFQLDTLLRKIDQGDLYYYRKQKFDGNSCVAPLPIPQYVINRYFPKHKGFGWLSSSELLRILLAPERIGFEYRDVSINMLHRDKYTNEVFPISFNTSPSALPPLFHYSCKETYRIYVHLRNCIDYFIERTGLGIFDYVYYYERVWSLRFFQSLRDSFNAIDCLDDFKDFYSNGAHVMFLRSHGIDIAPTLSDVPLLENYNARKDVVQITESLIRLYDKKDKSKKVVNYVMSSNGHNV